MNRSLGPDIGVRTFVRTAQRSVSPFPAGSPLEGHPVWFRVVIARADWRIVFRVEDGHPVDIDYPDCRSPLPQP